MVTRTTEEGTFMSVDIYDKAEHKRSGNTNDPPEFGISGWTNHSDGRHTTMGTFYASSEEQALELLDYNLKVIYGSKRVKLQTELGEDNGLLKKACELIAARHNERFGDLEKEVETAA